MALQCRLCSAELDASSGGRCRQCRQLVCQNCIEKGTVDSPQGLLCRDCSAREEAAPKPPPPPPEPDATAPTTKPQLPWLAYPAFALLLLIIFGLIVLVPAWRIKRLTNDLAGGTNAVADQAAEDLLALGSATACKEIGEIARDHPRPLARERAIRLLGRFPHPKARTILKDLVTAPETPTDLRTIASDALAHHQRFSIQEGR